MTDTIIITDGRRLIVDAENLSPDAGKTFTNRLRAATSEDNLMDLFLSGLVEVREDGVDSSIEAQLDELQAALKGRNVETGEAKEAEIEKRIAEYTTRTTIFTIDYQPSIDDRGRLTISAKLVRKLEKVPEYITADRSLVLVPRNNPRRAQVYLPNPEKLPEEIQRKIQLSPEQLNGNPFLVKLKPSKPGSDDPNYNRLQLGVAVRKYLGIRNDNKVNIDNSPDGNYMVISKIK